MTILGIFIPVWVLIVLVVLAFWVTGRDLTDILFLAVALFLIYFIYSVFF